MLKIKEAILESKTIVFKNTMHYIVVSYEHNKSDGSTLIEENRVFRNDFTLFRKNEDKNVITNINEYVELIKGTFIVAIITKNKKIGKKKLMNLVNKFHPELLI